MLTNSEWERVMAKREDIRKVIVNCLPVQSDADLDAMLRYLSHWLNIPYERVVMLDRVSMGHVDYVQKFSLRLAHEYFGVQ